MTDTSLAEKMDLAADAIDADELEGIQCLPWRGLSKADLREAAKATRQPVQGYREFFHEVAAHCFGDGADLDYQTFIDLGVKHALLIRTSYDPEKHGPCQWGTEPGDDWYVISDKPSHRLPDGMAMVPVEWNSVNAPPEDDTAVLLAIWDRSLEVAGLRGQWIVLKAYRQDGMWIDYEEDGDVFVSGTTDLWQPLPAAPSGETGGGV